MLPELNTEQRKEIYKNALAFLEKTNNWNALCPTLKGFLVGQLYVPNDDVPEIFPEFGLFEPEVELIGGFGTWFGDSPPHDENRQAEIDRQMSLRKDVLRLCIAMTEDI